MSNFLFAIIDDRKQDVLKLEKQLGLLNFKSLSLSLNPQDMNLQVASQPIKSIFISSLLFNEITINEFVVNLKKKYNIPLIMVYKEKYENTKNNIVPNFPIDFISANYNIHELALVIEKVLNKSEQVEEIINTDINKFAQERYNYIFENTGLGIFQSTLKGKFIAVNKALSKMLGYVSPKELIESIDNISNQIYVEPKERELIIKTLQTKPNNCNQKIKCRRKDGIIVMLKVHFRLMFNNEINAHYIEGIAEDFTYHNRAKDALKDNILQLKESHKLLRLASYQKNFNLNQYFLSDNIFEILDIVDNAKKQKFSEDLLFEITHPEDKASLIQIWSAAIAQKTTSFKTSFRIIGSSGKIIHINLDSIMQYNNSFEAVNQYVAIQDVSEQKIAEEQLKVSLIEKEVLLREINHRVKNNLQVVSSILNLQSGYTKDNKTIEILNECKNRVFSMSLVHEKLCQSNNLAQIDYKIYLEELISNLIQSFNLTQRKISVKILMDRVLFPIDIAIPCGMIITELVTNAAKYAFPEKLEGEILISIENIKEKEWKLTIKDNGVGFPESFSIENTETLGLKLVDSLVEQLNGSIEYISNNGLIVYVLFKEKNKV